MSSFSDFDGYLTVVAVKKLRVDGWRRTYIRISYRNQVAEGRRREREREKKKSGFFHPHTPPAIYPPWRLSIKTKERERDSSIVVVARQEEESKEDEGSEEKSF